MWKKLKRIRNKEKRKEENELNQSQNLKEKKYLEKKKGRK